MNYTTNWPTEPGYYWTWNGRNCELIELARSMEVHVSEPEMKAIRLDEYVVKYYVTHFKGPLTPGPFPVSAPRRSIAQELLLRWRVEALNEKFKSSNAQVAFYDSAWPIDIETSSVIRDRLLKADTREKVTAAFADFIEVENVQDSH